ncbi:MULTISPECIES: hypothetical protein [unclassified Lysobacter]|uniref:hypothetical protein n=1 Tax=unclassified Lysobacter TaxID=2635362 RepID=UPI001BE77CC5|nr:MULTISPECIES: hypothetical protein [unclassified Lysobacter]MBT2748374.1 hypothetical protein [Lysobacter sp. ISL-42]MBT2749859.1 hypothetical protein [Lysobacter sp. ISL-50]MBT2781187.1 hypothetical protein [Lysobacter sp. ISL-52]
MTRQSPLQERYPNREGIYTELRKLSAADLHAQIQHLLQQAQQHHEHARALIDYRDRVVDQSRHGR